MFHLDWPVLIRQLLLVFVPVLVSRGIVPAYLADPLVELAAYLVGTVLVGWVIWLGQRREAPDAKIKEVMALPDVEVDRADDQAIVMRVVNPELKT